MIVWALECVGAWFPFFGFQSWRVDLGIRLAAPTEFPMVFRFMWPIAFDAFSTLDSTRECCVTPLPTILALWYAGVHVGSPNGRDVVSDVETSVD